MRRSLLGLLSLAIGGFAAASAGAAPFAPAVFHKGRSALVYDTSTIERDGDYIRVWAYLIVKHPMDGATMVAYRREFACGVSQGRDLARRFVDDKGNTIRAVETPGDWQAPDVGFDDYELLARVCGRKAAGPAVGKGMSVFDYQDVVQAALGATVTAQNGPGVTRTASR
jgi:hypothetical protein